MAEFLFKFFGLKSSDKFISISEGAVNGEKVYK